MFTLTVKQGLRKFSRRFERQPSGCSRVRAGHTRGASQGGPGHGQCPQPQAQSHGWPQQTEPAGSRVHFRAPYNLGRENNLTALFLAFCPLKMGKNYSMSYGLVITTEWQRAKLDLNPAESVIPTSQVQMPRYHLCRQRNWIDPFWKPFSTAILQEQHKQLYKPNTQVMAWLQIRQKFTFCTACMQIII